MIFGHVGLGITFDILSETICEGATTGDHTTSNMLAAIISSINILFIAVVSWHRDIRGRTPKATSRCHLSSPLPPFSICPTISSILRRMSAGISQHVLLTWVSWGGRKVYSFGELWGSSLVFGFPSFPSFLVTHVYIFILFEKTSLTWKGVLSIATYSFLLRQLFFF